MNKHKSYNIPPDVPYFKKHMPNGTFNPGGPNFQAAVSMSPEKRVSMRTGSISQLKICYDFLEDFAISQSVICLYKVL